MQIVFRVDASLLIGTGHVMRCLTLADNLRDLGNECTFICRDQPGHLFELITTRGFRVLPIVQELDNTPTSSLQASSLTLTESEIKSDAFKTLQLINDSLTIGLVDWIVVDHYGLDIVWEKYLRKSTKHLLVIDDLANRKHDCDLLVDNNLGRSPNDYEDLSPANTIKLIGPRYSLLRPEFALLRKGSITKRIQNPTIKKIFISLGGVDINNTTCEVLTSLSLCLLPVDTSITVVMGPHAPWLAEVRAKAIELPWKTSVLVSANNIAELMVDSDIAIGAAGVSAWERCALGLPSIVFVLADNQIAGADALNKAGAAIVLNSASDLVNTFRDLLKENSALLIKELIDKSSSLTDGTGCTHVANKMLNFHE